MAENIEMVGCYLRVRILATLILVNALEVSPKYSHVPVDQVMQQADVAVPKEVLYQNMDSGEDVIRDLLIKGRKRGYSWDPAKSLFGALVYSYMEPEIGDLSEYLRTLSKEGETALSSTLRQAFSLPDDYSIRSMANTTTG